MQAALTNSFLTFFLSLTFTAFLLPLPFNSSFITLYQYFPSFLRHTLPQRFRLFFKARFWSSRQGLLQHLKKKCCISRVYDIRFLKIVVYLPIDRLLIKRFFIIFIFFISLHRLTPSEMDFPLIRSMSVCMVNSGIQRSSLSLSSVLCSEGWHLEQHWRL